MKLGEFISATKHLAPNTELFVAAVGDKNNEGSAVDGVLVNASEEAIDITLMYSWED